MDIKKQIRQTAAQTLRNVRERTGSRAIGYNVSTVAWIDRFIEKQRTVGLDQDTVDGLINNFGCLLGQCIIECHGGSWVNRDGSWAVQFDDRNAVFPFNKLQKQFEHGHDGGDSVLSMFNLVPKLFATKPWWKW